MHCPLSAARQSVFLPGSYLINRDRVNFCSISVSGTASGPFAVDIHCCYSILVRLSISTLCSPSPPNTPPHLGPSPMSGNPSEKRGPSSGVDNAVHDYDPSTSPALIDDPSGPSIVWDTTTHYPDIHLRPAGLKGLFYYPYTQVVLLGFVCFSCPGLFNALNGLGAGGQVDTTTSANANSTLYATFAIAAFFAGYVTFIFSCLPY